MGIKIRLFIVFCIGIVLVGGALALFANMHLHRPAYAARTLPGSDLSVVGPPSLPASTVNAIFARLGSPMAGTGALVEQTSRQVNIDDAFALAVWWTETNDGAAGVGLADRNPGSVRGSVGYPSAYDGYTIYPSYADAVVYWFHMLQNIYVNRGLTTVYAISHPYVGTSTSYLWAGKVVALMLRYRGEAPPPPTPTVSPTAPTRNIHIARPINTGSISASTQSSASTVSNQPSTLHIANTLQEPQPQNTTLSATATWLIAICALLLALALALYARLLPASQPASTRPAILNNPPLRASFTAPITDALYSPAAFHLPSRPLHEPQTDALAPMPSASAPATFLPAASKLRRTQLKPAPPTSDDPQKVPVAVGGRPTGLLARYGNIPNG